MTKITPTNLMQAGYYEMPLNNGVMMEYWKPIWRHDSHSESHSRLSVRFNEFPDKPFAVYIISIAISEARGVKTMEDLETLRRLLDG